METQPPAPGPATISGRPRRRAIEACTFCRKRKIKCNGEKPTCANCKIYGKECTFEPLGDSSRAGSRESPASVRRSYHSRAKTASSVRAHQSHPAQETNGDRDREPGDGEGGDGGRTRRGGSAATDARPEADRDAAPRRSRTGISRIVVSPNGVSSYHGQTSTLFEENQPEKAHASDARPRMPDEWVEKGLVAEAAKQRHLEEYNFRTGALDFDGVDPELGMHLLSLHWNRQHHSFNITYRPAFMRDMACAGPYFSKLLLNAIYFGAAKFSPRHDIRKDPDDVRTAGWRFRERVRELMGSALDKSDITTIQALLVVANTLFALGDERSAAWLYSGLAFRMIIDLGMHVDAPDLGSSRKFSDEDMEIRRRVFWAAFIVDKMQSLYQGRPVTLKESDASVPIKFLDTYEELEHWKPFTYNSNSASYAGSPAYSVSTFTSLCRLSVAMSDILSCIYTERAFNQSASELSDMLDKLNSKLADWRAALPEHLVFDPNKTTQGPPPHVFSLHAMYNVLIILLHRPFVSDGHLYNTDRSVAINSLITCATAADRIVALLRTYDATFSIRRAPYLISYACYVAATIHARIAAKRSAGSEAHSSLETCLAIFRENQETNWAVRRAYAFLQNLMKRLGVTCALDGSVGGRRQAEQGSPALEDTESHGENAVIQAAGSVPDVSAESVPLMGWSDIDGIIQSFARGQDSVYSGTHDANGFSGDNGLQSRAMGMAAPHPGIEALRASEFRHPMDDTNPYWSGGPQDGGSASIDDLLFGFNSSALDSSPFFDWSR